ncbi:MAG: FadR family transcriptional regulator [Deltaproteobacteria bacterium]|nr:FadR family transcriptional regulator [Deltaproteobacteria bacterium]
MSFPEKQLFTPINNRRAFEQVSTKIKELIFRGVLKPGDKLPSETHLAAQFNVGRQTIREALRLLELSGFIVIQKGGTGGPEIVNTVLNRIRDLFLDAFRIKNISMKDLTVARLEIEKVVLLYAMLNMDESDIQSLKANIRKARRKIEAGRLATEENIQFHKLLAKASKNHVFVIVLEAIMALVGDFLSQIVPDLEVSANVVRYHEEILAALVAEDQEKALELCKQHLLEVESRLNRLAALNSEP